ncbi:MAG: MerR family transcriptional regulator [Betaproteobacteria bacterium]|nr:MerR family transcriptional regulator [Betaproteobacteria bacterium]
MAENNERGYPAVPDRRLFAIGEAARLARSKPHTLRYWEKEIPALAKVVRRNGRRYYSREQVLMLQQIAALLAGGSTLAGAGMRLENKPAPSFSPARLRRELEKVLSVL